VVDIFRIIGTSRLSVAKCSYISKGRSKSVHVVVSGGSVFNAAKFGKLLLDDIKLAGLEFANGSMSLSSKLKLDRPFCNELPWSATATESDKLRERRLRLLPFCSKVETIWAVSCSKNNNKITYYLPNDGKQLTAFTDPFISFSYPAMRLKRG
jgi:hypothetical protein